MMAIFCLAKDFRDLKERIARTVVAFTVHNEPVTVQDLGVEGALTLLLKDAFKPNLVQTLEHTPAIIHGGPFANIAHGCNSLIATKTALKLADYVITEAGFGADLGAEKFLDIKCRIGELNPSAVVIVATIRALKMHGGVPLKELHKENSEALIQGFANLKKHVETMEQFGLPYIVALNRFTGDHSNEIATFDKLCREQNIPYALTEVWEKGGRGGNELADKMMSLLSENNNNQTFAPLYEVTDSIEQKLTTIATKVYGADGIKLSAKAKKQVQAIEDAGWANVPVCIAKTQYSLSDDRTKIGRPDNFMISIREFKPSVGAGFIVAYAGDMLTMPGLPKRPAAMGMDLDESGKVTGLF